ncbi:MAG: hypothetical protein HQ557_18030 [Bacteroidetes bacterium]|nr:hypothetical protein [Bacteroidota bacterium]
MRTAVERVNSRIDESFGFEQHTIRGRQKLEIRITLAVSIMLSLAFGWHQKEKLILMRSLLKTG